MIDARNEDSSKIIFRIGAYIMKFLCNNYFTKFYSGAFCCLRLKL